MSDYKNIINLAFERTQSAKNLQSVKNLHQLTATVEKVIDALSCGNLRVCEKQAGNWVVHEWIKKAILLYFRLRKMKIVKCGDLSFYDKIPLKSWGASEGVRVVPHALVRAGAFVAKNTVLMPSYINIGAYIDTGSMVDTWATVGSCAQVGCGVHLSGGVGLGGVLEPLQARPVIIEDHVFVGSRSIIVEGALIRKKAVIGAGVVITASTRIIDVTHSTSTVFKGEVPENAIVIPGHTEKTFPAGKFSIPCALIIGKRNPKTDLKTSLNEVLREYPVS